MGYCLFIDEFNRWQDGVIKDQGICPVSGMCPYAVRSHVTLPLGGSPAVHLGHYFALHTGR